MPKKATSVFIAALALSLSGLSMATAQERPNFLWLTIEDTSPYGFGSFGGQHVQTPNIDQLAAKGIRYSNASSTASQCSPARSTLVTGSFATTYGMDIHREPYETPAGIFYPEIMKANGYYVTNAYKTDYNTTFNDAAMWHQADKNATYLSKDRAPNQPFLAVFNTHATHMGRVRTITTQERGNYKKLGINPAELVLPPHVPDLPAIRSDLAVHAESFIGADKWVASFLAQLQRQGEADNTIIFFYSDHGGVLPRGKGFPFESGLAVPLIIYIPKKWQKKYNIKQGVIDNRLVGFEDIAPTLFSLAGIDIPAFMQGKAFLGPQASREKAYQFGFRSNQENYHFDPVRTVRDKRFKYIRNYVPYKPYALRNLYQWGMPSNQAWDELVMYSDKVEPIFMQPYQPKASEMLFDLETDPSELSNLADNPKYAAKLTELRQAVSNHIRSSGDLGFFARGTRKKPGGLYNWVNKTNFPLTDMYHVAELASNPTTKDVPALSHYLNHPHAEIRYWGVSGFATLASRGEITELPKKLNQLAQTDISQVRATALLAQVFAHKDTKAIKALVKQFEANDNDAYSALETLTWYPDTKPLVTAHKKQFEHLLAINEANKDDRMSIYLKVRSLLVNIGGLKVSQLYPESEKQASIIKNINGRSFKHAEDYEKQ